MRTTMASAALLLVLAMALISAPLTAEAQKKKEKKKDDDSDLVSAPAEAPKKKAEKKKDDDDSDLVSAPAEAPTGGTPSFGAEAPKKKAEKKKDGDVSDLGPGRSFNCSLICKGRKGDNLVVCKESCAVGQKTRQLSVARILCHEKCFQQSQKKGAEMEETKACNRQCEKDFKEKAAVLIAACNKACENHVDPSFRDDCKQGCTPARPPKR